MFERRDTTLDQLPDKVLFWRKGDGEVNGQPVYAPRKTYYKDLGMIQEYGEFGRLWSYSDCGLTMISPVTTLDQPIR